MPMKCQIGHVRIQKTEAHLDPVSSSGWTLLAVGIWPVWEEGLQELVTTRADEIQKILQQKILVLVGHARHVVHDVSGIVLDEELRAASLEMRVTRE